VYPHIVSVCAPSFGICILLGLIYILLAICTDARGQDPAGVPLAMSTKFASMFSNICHLLVPYGLCQCLCLPIYHSYVWIGPYVDPFFLDVAPTPFFQHRFFFI
jgi:hypothetical protein